MQMNTIENKEGVIENKKTDMQSVMKMNTNIDSSLLSNR